jgi:hypothetical protein
VAVGRVAGLHGLARPRVKGAIAFAEDRRGPDQPGREPALVDPAA